MKTDECKDLRLSSCVTSNRATTPATHLPIFISYFIYFLFPLLPFLPSLSCVSNTFQLSHNNAPYNQNADGNAILLTCGLSAQLVFFTPLFSMGLWNCQSVVNKADLIPAIASQTALNILDLTETWIHPEDSENHAALSTTSPSLTPPVRL